MADYVSWLFPRGRLLGRGSNAGAVHVWLVETGREMARNPAIALLNTHSAMLTRLLTELQEASTALSSRPIVTSMSSNEPDTRLQDVEKLCSELLEILSSPGTKYSTDLLRACEKLKDIQYTVNVYYPPAAVDENYERSLSLEAIRLAAISLLKER